MAWRRPGAMPDRASRDTEPTANIASALVDELHHVDVRQSGFGDRDGGGGGLDGRSTFVATFATRSSSSSAAPAAARSIDKGRLAMTVGHESSSSAQYSNRAFTPAPPDVGAVAPSHGASTLDLPHSLTMPGQRPVATLAHARSRGSASLGSRRSTTTSSSRSSSTSRNNSRNARACSSSASSSEEDGWGAVQNGLRFTLGSSDDKDDGEASFFIPDAVFQVSKMPQKPDLPCHAQEELPVGVKVWVVDEEDVETILKINWNAMHRAVCNGRLPGELVRHSGNMAVVHFRNVDGDMDFTLTLPRVCLSLKPITPYESVRPPACSNDIINTCYSNLAPRAAQGRCSVDRDKPVDKVPRRYYEAISILDVPAAAMSQLGTAQQRFRQGALQEALNLVNSVLVEHAAAQASSAAGMAHPIGGDQGACEAARDYEVDALVLRSRVYVFLQQYALALQDAAECIRREPRWIRGQLCLARALGGLGEFAEADRAIRAARALLPMSAELDSIYEMNAYMMQLQERAISPPGVRLVLDPQYHKRWVVQRDLGMGEVICVETTPVIASASLFGPAVRGRCAVCFRAVMAATSSPSPPPAIGLGVVDRSPRTAAVASDATGNSTRRLPMLQRDTPADDADDVSPQLSFCSWDCLHRARLLLSLENRHHDGIERAKELILSKAAVSIDRYSLEMGYMTVRLFFLVVSTHRRLVAQQTQHQCCTMEATTRAMQGHNTVPSPSLVCRCVRNAEGSSETGYSGGGGGRLSVTAVLMHLGVYPLVSDLISNRLREEILVVYDVITQHFTAEEKALHTSDLFISLYTYVRAYFVPVELPSSTAPRRTSAKPCTVYYLPCLVASVERASVTTVLGSGTTELRNASPTLPQGAPGGSTLISPTRPAVVPNCEVRMVTAVPAAHATSAAATTPTRRPSASLLQLVVTEPIKKGEKLLLPPFVLDLSDFN